MSSVIVTGDPFRFIVTEQTATEEIAPAAILIEPEARNTAPAVLAGQVLAGLWIFLPAAVRFETSVAGQAWHKAGEAVHAVADREQAKTIREFTVPLNGRRARFVRVTAVSPAICPPWHPGRGRP